MMNSYKYDDEETLDMILEFEVERDGERTDEEDEVEIENANNTGITRNWGLDVRAIATG